MRYPTFSKLGVAGAAEWWQGASVCSKVLCRRTGAGYAEYALGGNAVAASERIRSQDAFLLSPLQL